MAVEHFLARSHPQPFFLSFGVDEPHHDNLARPELRLFGRADRHSTTRYYDPEKLDTRYEAPPVHLPVRPEIRREMASLWVGARIMDSTSDACCGRCTTTGTTTTHWSS